MATSRRLIAIVGPTASGKTALAIDLAEKWGGEIICADSRTVYKGMNIGTAKPSLDDQRRVPHWGIDLVYPDELFSVADFQSYAVTKITDIQGRGKIPFLVGGTGLYIDAVLYSFALGKAADKKLRRMLEEMTIEQLHEYCLKSSIKLPENNLNKRYVIRTIERMGRVATSHSVLPDNYTIVGIATNINNLRNRIECRTEQLFEANVAKEATMLGKKYGWEHQSMTGNIYPIIQSYLEGTASLEETKSQFTTLDYQLAKRQMTWFRRNPDILWADLTEARVVVNHLFASG